MHSSLLVSKGALSTLESERRIYVDFGRISLTDESRKEMKETQDLYLSKKSQIENEILGKVRAEYRRNKNRDLAKNGESHRD